MIAAKDNPFSVSRIHALGYQPQGISWKAIDRRLERLNFTAAVTGPHGSGKTTFMEQLSDRLTEKGVTLKKLFINQDSRLPWRTIRQSVLSIPPGGVLLFDGACHLSWWRWRQLKRLTATQKIGLVITSHDEGLLETLLRCETSPSLLNELVSQLAKPSPPLSRDTLNRLFAACGGNLRDCLRQLYDDYAQSN